MAEVKGKFITLACSLIATKPDAKVAALDSVYSMTGVAWDQLDPEGWYDASVFDSVFKAIEANTGQVLAWAAIKVIGRDVYPTIEATGGLPGDLNTPLEFIKFEAQGFLANHRGDDVKPRKFIKAEPGLVVVEAPSPGYNCQLIEGVFEGILEMCGIKSGKVNQSRCVRNGDPTCEYIIQW